MSRDRLHVVIAGGGVAAVESLLALRELAGRRVEITLLSQERQFLYRPVTVAEAFDRGEAHSYALEDIVDYVGGGEIIWERLESVLADERVAVTASGTRVPFDALIVATGAIATEPLPGALTFRGRGDVATLRGVVDDLLTGSARSIALTLPAERTWPLPIYELALLTAGALRQQARDADVWLVTPEEEPLELFGPAAVARRQGDAGRPAKCALRTSSLRQSCAATRSSWPMAMRSTSTRWCTPAARRTAAGRPAPRPARLHPRRRPGASAA